MFVSYFWDGVRWGFHLHMSIEFITAMCQYAVIPWKHLTLFCFPPSDPAGGSIDSDCAFEPDYAVPPLSMTEGMQHIRIMEGVSRSLPSSPLLTHQAISVRLQPVKKLTGTGSHQKEYRVWVSHCCHMYRKFVKEASSNVGRIRFRFILYALPLLVVCPPPKTHCTEKPPPATARCRQGIRESHRRLKQSEEEWSGFLPWWMPVISYHIRNAEQGHLSRSFLLYLM